MSRYADLRWKIADLEKELEEEKIYNRKLLTQLNLYYRQLYEKEKDFEVLKDKALENMRTKDAEIEYLKAKLKERENDG